MKLSLTQRQQCFLNRRRYVIAIYVRLLMVSRWKRITRWEFWPPWVFYLPVVGYIAFLALKHRSLTLFTCANPAIPGGGFIGESKMEILQNLTKSAQSQHHVARAQQLPILLDHETRLRMARQFMADNKLDFPVVLKPDVGQRGSGVAIARSERQLEEYLLRVAGDTIIQEYIAGFEFGVFYYRYPSADRGEVFSITEKRFPFITGDGTSTLERLILKDERAVCMARAYFKLHRDHLWEIPGKGEMVQLVELGTHCRGAIFLDGSWIKTIKLVEAIDRLSREFEGFYFGRFDIRTPSVDDFKQGKNFKVIELNGVTSEATHIYDPHNSLFTAYKALFEQWRIAFEIGAQNRARGVEPTPLRTLVKLLLASLENAKGHPPSLQATHGNISCASRV